MKKRILAALICAALALNLTACANNSNEDPVRSDKSSKESSTSSVVSEPSGSDNSDPANSDNSSSDSNPSEPAYPEATNVLYAQGKKLDFPETPLTDFDYEIKGDYAVIKEYFGKNSDVRIPETIEGKRVYLGYGSSTAFNGNNAIKRLILPDGVYLSKVENMYSVEEITFLGDFNFNSSSSLVFGANVNNVYFGGNIPERYRLEQYFEGSEWYKTIADHKGIVVIDDTLICGYNCTGDVVVPKGVKKINDEAFVYVDAFDYLGWGNAIDIGFMGAPAKLTSVTLPDGLESIGKGAFCNTGLTSINIPDSVASIGAFAFSETPYLKSIKNEDKLAIAGKWLIDGTSAYGHVTIPDGVTRIASVGLSGPNSLTTLKLQSVTFPEGIEYIGDNAIRYTEFKEVTIPDNFKSLTYVGENGLWAFWDLDEYKDSEMLVFEKVVVLDINKNKDAGKTLTIPDGVNYVATKIASGSTKNTPYANVILPDSVTKYNFRLSQCAETITYKGTTYKTRGDNYAEGRAALQAAIEG